MQLNNARGLISGFRRHVYREMQSSHCTWHSCCFCNNATHSLAGGSSDRLRIFVVCTQLKHSVRGTHFPVQVCPRSSRQGANLTTSWVWIYASYLSPCLTWCKWLFSKLKLKKSNKTGNVRITRHWGAFLLLQWKSSECYILWLCVCILRHPACNAHATYFYLWPVRLYDIFQHYLVTARFYLKNYWTQNVSFWFSLRLLSETFLILRRTEKCILVLM
jgi:hypothetical protein